MAITIVKHKEGATTWLKTMEAPKGKMEAQYWLLGNVDLILHLETLLV